MSYFFAAIPFVADIVVARLRELRAAETRKRTREEARNTLEAYTYRVRDLLEKSEFTKAATKAELSAIGGLRDEVAEWLGDYAETASTKELKQKKADLEYVPALYSLVDVV